MPKTVHIRQAEIKASDAETLAELVRCLNDNAKALAEVCLRDNAEALAEVCLRDNAEALAEVCLKHNELVHKVDALQDSMGALIMTVEAMGNEIEKGK